MILINPKKAMWLYWFTGIVGTVVLTLIRHGDFIPSIIVLAIIAAVNLMIAYTTYSFCIWLIKTYPTKSVLLAWLSAPVTLIVVIMSSFFLIFWGARWTVNFPADTLRFSLIALFASTISYRVYLRKGSKSYSVE